jgi:hypothetical protein
MTNREFNDAVADIVLQCQHRNNTFATDHICWAGPQTFEGKTTNEVLEDALEEVLDLINYSVQIALKLKDLQRNLPCQNA